MIANGMSWSRCVGWGHCCCCRITRVRVTSREMGTRIRGVEKSTLSTFVIWFCVYGAIGEKELAIFGDGHGGAFL